MFKVQSRRASKKIGFLIEGQGQPSDRFPEVEAAIVIAKNNNGFLFDSISSFDNEHMAQAFQRCQNESETKTLVLSVLLAFSEFGSPEQIISILIKEPYQYMIDNGKSDKMPDWLHHLNSSNLSEFSNSILTDFYEGDTHKFKQANSLLWKDIINLSNRLSAGKTIDILTRQSIDTVYGLIGADHLPMLDNQGKVIVGDDTYRHVQIKIGARTVDIHLFGGLHGELEHYERMAKFLAARGLHGSKLGLAEKDNVLNTTLLLQRGLTSQNSTTLSEKESPKKEVLSISECVAQFNYWMKTYIHPGDLSHNQRMIQWLTFDSGGDHIQTYTAFCELAKRLADQGYETNPPPTVEEFYDGLLAYFRKPKQTLLEASTTSGLDINLEEALPLAPAKEPEPTCSIAECAAQFDYWMKTYIHHDNLSHNQEMTNWLFKDYGAAHIKTYKQFCELAKHLADQGYKTNPPATQAEFDKGMSTYFNRRTKRKSYKEASEPLETRLSDHSHSTLLFQKSNAKQQEQVLETTSLLRAREEKSMACFCTLL
ncbi:hypothetical protein [Legionella taurinensis]|uniref:hypothetical protein n=1 Tax=Legionella taurinensis TaxID=70611 RepID=UPI00299DAC79|nr:hypothetical protein [Legionella taurinensis]MDX1837297.1 hypothetical protein [Legionella taurinensis]